MQTRAFAFSEGEKQIENVLLTHKAIHSFVEKVQKPEVYRLKEQGHLYADYFSPKLLSRTYIARGIEEYFNQESQKIGLPSLYFKLAAERLCGDHGAGAGERQAAHPEFKPDHGGS